MSVKLLLRQNGRRVFNCAGWLAGWRDAPVKRLSLLRACYGSAAKYCGDRVCLSVCLSVCKCICATTLPIFTGRSSSQSFISAESRTC